MGITRCQVCVGVASWIRAQEEVNEEEKEEEEDDVGNLRQSCFFSLLQTVLYDPGPDS